MTTQTGYFRITSGAIGLVNQSAAAAAVNFHQVEPWRERLEREMLENARRDATRGERSAAEQALWEQVSGKAPPAAQVSPQLGAVLARFQATRPQPSRREVELESRLFEQVAAIGPRRPLGGDSRHSTGKAGL